MHSDFRVHVRSSPMERSMDAHWAADAAMALADGTNDDDNDDDDNCDSLAGSNFLTVSFCI